MQDTAEGFGQPIRQIFEPFFRMERELPTPFDTEPRYRVSVEDPLLALALPAAGAAVERWHALGRPAAAGRIAVYLLYSFVTLITVLLVVTAMSLARRLLATAGTRRWRCCWRRCSAAGSTSGAPGCRTARRPACCSPTARCTSCSTRNRCWPTTPRRCSAARRTSFSAAWRWPAPSCPTLSTDLPLSPAADAIALVGLFALARVFISLAAMDVGTSFGTLGARREMLIGFLAEPALLMVLFSASLISKSTSLTTIVETLAHRDLAIYPSLAFAGVAFTMVSLAENARVPVDNPATHLELTMIHEAMILEYSGRHLALLEWAASLKLFAYSCIGLALFFPWGVAEAQAPLACCWRCRRWCSSWPSAAPCWRCSRR
jgi:hypothetical protein